MSLALERRAFALPRSAEPDLEIFAIGDIHGRSDLLDALLDQAAREPRRAPRRAMVFLGDLTDRGYDSLGAMALATDAGGRVGADESVGLMGNHEAMMRLALDPATPTADAVEAFELWLLNGGDRVAAALASFVEPPPTIGDYLAALREALPARVWPWLAALRSHWRSGRILFVHAGVNPRIDLETFLAAPWNAPLGSLDEDRHWAWVRWPFIDGAPGPDGWSGYFVVHGHTPRDAKDHASHAEQIANFRLNLDAGSGLTGVAEMAIIRGDQAEVVAARGPTNRELWG